MCKPEMLAKLELGGTGMTAGVQWQQARYEAGIARQNEIMANRQLDSVRQAGADEATALRERGKQIAGQQKAAIAANGGDVSKGSALSLLSDTAYLSELDARTALKNSEGKAQDVQAQINAYRSARKNAGKFAPVTVGSTLLTGGAKAYGRYNDRTT